MADVAGVPLEAPAEGTPGAGNADGRGDARPPCEGCGKAPSKYCCPGCGRRSCSLECVKAHKEETGCTGKRDRAAFVGRGHWDERHLLSDYRFLEEVKLADDVARRSRPPAPKQELPPFLQTLIYQAGRRGVQLHILAPGMAKRVHNSTRFDPRQKLLRWHVEWSFVAAGVKVADQRVHENTKVGEILRQHLTLQPGEALKHHQLRDYAEAFGAAAGQAAAGQVATGLDAAAGAGLGGSLVVLLKKERMPANAPQYYRIDLNQVLSKQLAGKVLVEYPTFLVLLPHEAGEYALVQPAPQLAPKGSAGADATATVAGGAPGAAAAGSAAGASPACPPGSIHPTTAAAAAAAAAAGAGGSPAAPPGPRPGTDSSGDGSPAAAALPAPMPAATALQAAGGSAA